MRPPEQETAVRPLGDDKVGGHGVEAQRCVERTCTNRPRAYPSERRCLGKVVGVGRCSVLRVCPSEEKLKLFVKNSFLYVFFAFCEFFHYLLTPLLIYVIMAIVECG